MSPLSLSMQDLQRRQLDAQLGADARLLETEQPESGWLFAIRKSLGMQTRQFARLLRITPQAASAIERSEREGTITLASLRKAADALNCDVVLALVPRESLTRDHLIPISRGGANEWTNVVTACSSCNTRKANRLPDEIGMHPMQAPVEPHFVHLSWAVRRLTPIQARYIRVFYGEATLKQLEELDRVDPRTALLTGTSAKVSAG